MKKKFFVYSFLLILLSFLFSFYLLNKNLIINKQLVINHGDGFRNLISDFSYLDKISLLAYNKINNKDTSIFPGVYNFSGSYTKSEFFEKINKGPDKNYTYITIIEGRSIYDIDDYLANNGYINFGDYINYVSDKKNISKYIEKYEFLKFDFEINNLEGFLYPDTYKIDLGGDFLGQLVDLQLQNFNKKVWEMHKNDFDGFNQKLNKDGNNYNLSFYDIIILASIIEKEENLNQNKPEIAGIFINRLNSSCPGAFRIDADITLCYGLKKPYKYCTSSVIVENLYDSDNLYNTRAVSGLTPSPISNPELITIESLLNYNSTNKCYYLHDNNGKIHSSVNIQEHNILKSKYLNK
ncbi:YceG family protein [Candidatus Vampirococcus lugosii]|uniref:Endolytic murein transglycosylase n=1 Tax=Candidatus Vampirococcus lugosii TaxID=2789015 RepID=A0ABS5QMZ9_9BACT|nr:YceG family protein [Candidatus Vampirococcus lugosii]